LKLFVVAIVLLRSAPSAFSVLVVLPIGPGILDVALLALLGATRQQDHQHIAIAPEIHPEARPEIQSVFKHALANRLYVGEVALLHPGDRACHLGSRHWLNIREPFGKRLAAVCGHVVADVEHGIG
jgi:hypothetical protein